MCVARPGWRDPAGRPRQRAASRCLQRLFPARLHRGATRDGRRRYAPGWGGGAIAGQSCRAGGYSSAVAARSECAVRLQHREHRRARSGCRAVQHRARQCVVIGGSVLPAVRGLRAGDRQGFGVGRVVQWRWAEDDLRRGKFAISGRSAGPGRSLRRRLRRRRSAAGDDRPAWLLRPRRPGEFGRPHAAFLSRGLRQTVRRAVLGRRVADPRSRIFSCSRPERLRRLFRRAGAAHGQRRWAFASARFRRARGGAVVARGWHHPGCVV